MRKSVTLISALVLGLSVGSAAIAAQAPQGFADSAAVPAGPQGFTENMAPVSVASVLANGQDDQFVMMKGRLSRYLGDERYEFVDGTGSMIVELDEDRSWSHIRKDQLIVIYGDIDRDWDSVKVDVKKAVGVER